jgi:hypothetical protein
MKKILLITISIMALMSFASAIGCGIYTPTCEELPSYVVCDDYYMVDGIYNYSCEINGTLDPPWCSSNHVSECVFEYCDLAYNYWASRDYTSFHFGDVVDIFLFNYTCLGSTYWACYWNNTASSNENISYDSIYSFGQVEGYGGVQSLNNPTPLTEYSYGIQLSCNTAYLCIANNTEYNDSSMIQTMHYLRVDFYDNCSNTTTTSTSSTSSSSSSSSSSSAPSSSSTSSSSSPSSSSSSSSSLTTTTGPGGGNYTTVTYDTGTLPVMNGGTTPGIGEVGFGGGAGAIFGVAIQSFILICCFLIILIIMCTVKPVYFGILVSVLAGDFLIIVMQLMNIPANLFLLINALAIINFFRGVRG